MNRFGLDAFSACDGVNYYVEIDKEQVRAFHTFQSESMLCWAACVVMVLGNQGIYVTQRQVFDAIFEKNHCGVPHNCPATNDDLCRSLHLTGYDNCGAYFQVNSACNDGFPDFEQLIEQLRYGNPVVVAYRNASTIGHAVLIVGMKYFFRDGMIWIYELTFCDPAPQYANTFGIWTTTEVRKFVGQTYGHWIPEVRMKYHNNLIQFSPVPSALIEYF